MSSVFTHVMKPVRDTNSGPGVTVVIACVASVSVWFRSKERGTRVKDHTKNGTRKRAGRGWGRKEGRCLQTNPGILKTAHLVCHA